ncbi:MAG: type II toxin-antitoxin system RelE/ParE family toxin [Okeania sp. SIO3C4]|nr:type II toxin-antitoxin system RelE/ParE family toxin [Okeania sp. SIO3C4]
MSYKVTVSEVAKLDMADAAEYYEVKSKGLGKVFLLSAKHTFKMLARNPFIYVKVYKEVRRALTAKFPYAVYYQINESEKLVTVYSVRSTYQHPESWKNSLDE